MKRIIQYSLQSSGPIPLEYVKVCHQFPEPKPYNSLSPHVYMMAHTCICHVILSNLVLHMAFSDGVRLDWVLPLKYQWAFLLMTYIYRNTVTTYQPTDLGLFCCLFSNTWSLFFIVLDVLLH